jgi:hypothetical protein
MNTPNLDQTQFDHLAIQVKDRPHVDEIRFGATSADVLPVEGEVPEPASAILFALGVAGLAAWRRRTAKVRA